ncbi:MAG: hypothetical protein OSB69_00380 [Alphaproteobacteria bacterium]|nr:hypothetical protein [Alphaproteobacteria bacterium]
MCVAGIDFPTSGYFLNNFNMVFGRSLHDAATWEWFERITAEDGAKTFWDVGANVGLCGCTLISAAADRTAVLFEPDPDNLTVLSNTIYTRDLALRVELRSFTVGAKTGTAAVKRD